MFDENVSFYYVSDEKVERSALLRFCKKSSATSVQCALTLVKYFQTKITLSIGDDNLNK